MATTNAHLERVYQQALQRYQWLYDKKGLKREHFDIIRGHTSIEEVLSVVRHAEIKGEIERSAVQRVLGEMTETLVKKLSRFVGVVDTAIQSSVFLFYSSPPPASRQAKSH